MEQKTKNNDHKEENDIDSLILFTLRDDFQDIYTEPKVNETPEFIDIME